MVGSNSGTKRPASSGASASKEKKRKADEELREKFQHVESLLTKHRSSATPSLQQEVATLKTELDQTRVSLTVLKEEKAKAEQERLEAQSALAEREAELEDMEEEYEGRLDAIEAQHQADVEEKCAERLKQKDDETENLRLENVYYMDERIGYADNAVLLAKSDESYAKWKLKKEKRQTTVWRRRCQALYGMLKGEVQDKHKDDPSALDEIMKGLRETFAVHMEGVGSESETDSDSETDSEWDSDSDSNDETIMASS